MGGKLENRDGRGKLRVGDGVVGGSGGGLY